VGFLFDAKQKRNAEPESSSGKSAARERHPDGF
jgi:hypothetical protein